MFVAPQAPAIFLRTPGTGIPAASAVIVDPNGAQTPLPLFDCSDELGCGFLPIPLSTAGARQIYVSFFATGIKNFTAGNITCSIKGVTVPVTPDPS